MKTLLSVLLLISVYNLSIAQELYTSKEFKTSYNKNTRSLDGKPGKNYWQNSADYKIKAEFNPETRLLKGEETITYYNNSPDTLKRFLMKLYMNMYKSTSPRNSEITKETFIDGMKIEYLSFNGKEIKDTSSALRLDGTNLYFMNIEPITPKSKTEIKVRWSFINPVGTRIRVGTYDSLVSFIGYWYPRPAVYDDINGWDIYPYDGEHEFYNDYSNYDVEITVPDKFVVWGTGMLENAKEVLADNVYEKYKKALTSEEKVMIISNEDLQKGNYLKGNTFHYKADNVIDFAFGLSNYYVWDGVAATVEGNRKVLVNTCFDPNNKNLVETIEYAKKTILDLSNRMPAVAYPYPQITSFQGDGGMEFPMIVNDGDLQEKVWNVYVTSHEISHQYFPFYVGTNETKYGWMDEGFGYFLPYDTQIELSGMDHRIRAAKGFGMFAGREKDMPMMIPSVLSHEPELSMLIYYKPAIAYEMMIDLLGKDLFLKGMKEYIARWNGKHPTPYDFFYTFNDVAKRDLNWFWKSWFFERGYPDLGIKDVKMNGKKAIVTVEKTGVMPTPIYLKFTLEDGKTIDVYESLNIWENKNMVEVTKEIDGNVVKVEVGNPKVPDSVPTNNIFEFKGAK
ncbi:MAG TPA: M1 family metallopeptidase [Ignavibacteriaceae bacterium]|nr:M1 family metallopeptidase [Ignavibacteriaceae bacterium]